MKLFIKSMLVVALIWIAIPVQGKKPDSPAYLIVYYKMDWADGDVKYLFMSKYLIQCPDYNEHNGMAELTSFSTNLWNQFNDVIVQKIVQDEWDPTLSVRDGVHDVPEEVQEISEWSVEGGNNGEFIFYDDVDRQDSPLQAALKIRNQIIKEAKDEGYTIRQVSFLPKSGDTNGSDYDFSFYDGDRKEHLYCNISITNPLSIYEVVPYSKGEVKKEVEGYETKKSSSNNSSSSQSSSETTYSRFTLARQFENEGDYFKNNSQYDQAIEKYNKSLRLYDNPAIRQKIKDAEELQTNTAILEGLDAVTGAIGDLAYEFNNNLDYIGVPTSNGVSFILNGLDVKDPFKMADIHSASILYSHYRVLVFEFGATYSKSPDFLLNLNISENDPSHLQKINTMGAGLTANIGVSIPIRSFMAYTTLGYDFIKSFRNESLVDKITFEDGSDFLPSYFQFNWKTGFLFKIPQSPVSLGLTYTFSKINVPIDWYGDKIVKLESIPDWSFRIENNYSHEYSFHRLGIVLYLSHKKDETYW